MVRDVTKQIYKLLEEKLIYVPSSAVTYQIISKYTESKGYSEEKIQINADEEIVLNVEHYHTLFKKKRVLFVSSDFNALSRSISNDLRTYSYEKFSSLYSF